MKLEEVQTILKHVSYHGMKFYVHEENNFGILMFVFSIYHDVLDSETLAPVEIRMVKPAIKSELPDEESILKFVWHLVLERVTHEAQEFFTVYDKKPYDPHGRSSK